ncbi:MAG: hypothetical protein V3V96_12495 [Acidiferrobacterales bacterium]
MATNTNFSNKTNVVLALLLPVYLLFHTLVLTEYAVVYATTDEGFISILTLGLIAGTLAMIIYVLAAGDRTHKKVVTIRLAYVVLIYFLREADFHRLFTPEHITRGAFYASKDVPLLDKLIAATSLILFLISFLYIAVKYFSLTLRRALKLQAWAVSLALWAVILFASQLCDRLSIKIPGHGRVLEESLEFWAAIYAFVAALTWQRLWKNNIVQRSG